MSTTPHNRTIQELKRIDASMGVGGIGVYQHKQFIGAAQIESLAQELRDSPPQAWHDSHETFINNRGVEVEQNFHVLALKLSRGDTTLLRSMIEMQVARCKVEDYIRALGVISPIFAEWQADEAITQRYTKELGLSFHRDNARHIGAIAILNVCGQADLEVKTQAGDIASFTQRPGDLTLLRGKLVIPGKPHQWAPEHRVVRVRGERMSLTFRDNQRPDDPIPNFYYANWGPSKE